MVESLLPSEECPGAISGHCIAEWVCKVLSRSNKEVIEAIQKCTSAGGVSRVCCQKFPDCKELVDGFGYIGSLNVSESGRPWLAWTRLF